MDLIDREVLHQLLEKMMEAAKMNREKWGYKEGNERFTPVAMIVNQEQKIDFAITAHRNHEEKVVVYAEVSRMARERKSPLVVVITDARVVVPEKFCAYYGLPLEMAKDGEKFQEAYHDMLAQHGGYLGHCPVAVWQDVLVVVSKSPVLPTQMRMLPYREGVGDSVVWLSEEAVESNASNVVELQMLPDWWDQSSTPQ